MSIEDTYITTSIEEDNLAMRNAMKDFDLVSLYDLKRELEASIKRVEKEIADLISDFENYEKYVDPEDPATKEAVKSHLVSLNIKQQQLEELKGNLTFAENLIKEKMTEGIDSSTGKKFTIN